MDRSRRYHRYHWGVTSMKVFFCFLFMACLSVTSLAHEREKFRPQWPVFEPGEVDCLDTMWDGAVCRRLAQPFAYRYNNKAYEAAPGLVTDGASIPDWATDLIGHGWDDEFVRAAVLHDYFVRRENVVLSYLFTQRLFYLVLIDSGVPEAKARLMYAAVILGSPKWSLFYNRRPKACVMFTDIECVRNNGGVEIDSVRDYVGAAYNSPLFATALEALLPAIQDASHDLDSLESIAIGARVVAGIPTPAPATYGSN